MYQGLEGSTGGHGLKPWELWLFLPTGSMTLHGDGSIAEWSVDQSLGFDLPCGKSRCGNQWQWQWCGGCGGCGRNGGNYDKAKDDGNMHSCPQAQYTSGSLTRGVNSLWPLHWCCSSCNNHHWRGDGGWGQLTLLRSDNSPGIYGIEPQRTTMYFMMCSIS